MHRKPTSRRAVLAAGVAAGLSAHIPFARAADKLRVAKAISSSFPFAGLELGQQMGAWASENFEVEISVFQGDGRMQQAFAANAIDFGLGSGPGMGYASKGVPARGVAALALEPRNMALVVTNNTGVKSIDDLKGKRIGVTTAGSLTDWLAIQVAMQKGWGPKGVTTVPVGGFDTSRAALKTKQIDALVFAAASGYVAEEAKEWRVLQTMGDVAPDFITHVLFATDKLLKTNPDAAGRFLKAWFETIDWMKANKQKTVEISAKVLNLEPSVMSRTFDAEIGMFSTDGVFLPKPMAVLKKSFVDMQILDSEPNEAVLIDTRFLPVKR